MEFRSSRQAWKGQVLCFFSIWSWSWVSGQLLRYSVLEESEQGTMVGNLAQDLGLNAAAVSDRRLRLGSEGSRRYFAVDLTSGALIVNEKIDRETLCGSSLSCLLPVEVAIENPLKLIRVEVEILDINDNSPKFVTSDRVIRITELLATPGSRFHLESAQDLDVGTNDVSTYRLNENQYFSLNVKNRKDGKISPELVLEKMLDREEKEKHGLILTVFDGGNPVRSGSTQITVIVLDLNDNAPAFDHSQYKVSLLENTPQNTLLIKLNATDIDEGPNGEIEYSFEDHALNPMQRIFNLDPLTGEIRVGDVLDFEVSSFYEISVIARDKGTPEMEGHCVIQVEIQDVNDNVPEIILSSMVNSVPENTPVYTTVGLFSVRDLDSGENGKVHLQIWPNPPFTFLSLENHYTLITNHILDREKVPQYTIKLTATDAGSPPLETYITILLNISDINDNPPRFSQPFFQAYLKENNEPGVLLCKVTATDSDEGENSRLIYFIAESQIQDYSVSSLFYINSQNGHIYTQRSFDYEQLQYLEISIWVEDSGSPQLSANVTVCLFIQDLNDNLPVILYPEISREHTARQSISQSVPANYLVTKVTAVDADSGHNAWLSYSILQTSDSFLFRVSKYTGEIRTARDFQETDSRVQRLLVLVKDNGEPTLSTTVTILVSLENQAFENNPKSGQLQIKSEKKSDVTLYLIISLVVISIISLVTFIIIFARYLRKNRNSKSSSCCLYESQSKSLVIQSNPALPINSNGTLKYMEVSLRPPEAQDPCYRTCFSPVSDGNDFTFMRPLNFPQLRDLMNETSESLSGISGLKEFKQQAQPNTEWRFSQAQRPGTSGSQNTEEGGVWPNNQLETERLQAMILASANEAADGNSTLGGAAGTMGLSTRYGPQFTLQHVPDYRQNVYIPGNTATLTNSAGKRDGKGSTSSGGNKKKSGKKEKK